LDAENEVVDNYLDNEDDNDDSTKSGKGKKDKFVTAREYYCFRLQVRRGLLNIILFGGRLFQQWAVDMYIKIESMRLDWYSKPENQKKIRAELYQVNDITYFHNIDIVSHPRFNRQVI
jgi:hypothetical protein